MCMWVSLDPPPSHVMGFQVVVLPPCFARPPQLVVRCGARTCIACVWLVQCRVLSLCVRVCRFASGSVQLVFR